MKEKSRQLSVVSSQPQTESRMMCADRHGRIHCLDPRAVVMMPSNFEASLQALRADLDLVADCVAEWGGVPIPVAQAVLRNLEAAQTAFDVTVRQARTPKPVTPGDRSSSLACGEMN